MPRSGVLRTQKLKSHLLRTQSLKVLPLNPGVGQYIAIHATLTAREFFLAHFYRSGPLTCIFSETSHEFFLCQLGLTPVPAQTRRIKQVTLLDAGSRVKCPWYINRLQNMCYCFPGIAFRIVDRISTVVLEKRTCGIMTRGMTDLEMD